MTLYVLTVDWSGSSNDGSRLISMNLGCFESTESSSEKSGSGRLNGDPAEKSAPFCLEKQMITKENWK